MKVIAKPKKEAKLLASVKKDADAKTIYEGIVAQAQCCVVHLCGCSKAQGC